MRRGTTPTITITTDIDLRDSSNMFVTFNQNDCTVFEKTLDDVTVLEDQVVVELSQKDTLLLKSCKNVEFQIRGTLGDKKYVSNIMKSTVERILKDGEI